MTADNSTGSNPRTATDWQKVASRRAFQGELPGAIRAMEQAVALEPNNFHHWMWLGKLHREIGNPEGSRHSAREALRCLCEAPDTSISPEERTRLIVRASLHAGEPDRALDAVSSLEALRRSALDSCLEADNFADWYEADLFAAPIFETLLELRVILSDPAAIGAAAGKYLESLELGIQLGREEDASPEDLEVLELRKKQVASTL